MKKTITLKDPQIIGKANTEVGSLLIIDPCMLFTHVEWLRVIAGRGTHQQCVIRELGKKLGLSRNTTKFLQGSACVAGTGGDAMFSVVSGDKSGLPIVIGWPGANS